MAAPRAKSLKPAKPPAPPAAAAKPAPIVAKPPPAPAPAPQTQETREKGIEAYGFFNAPIGLGEGARRNVDALRAAGVRVSAHAVDLKHIPLKVPYPVTDAAPAYDTALFNLNPSMWLRSAAGKVAIDRKIAIWHWELPVFPPRWMADTALVTEVWAPTRFIAEAIGAATKLPIRVVPHPAVVVPVERTAARQRLGLPQSRRIILSAFDFRSQPARKNPDGVLRAFRDAFPPTDEEAPLLLVKYHRSDAAIDGEQIARIRETPNVVVIDRSVTQEEMHDIYSAADAFVSLHRSEGFGLNILDMMALGKVCIATGFSGNLDFMDPQNSMLIPWTMRAVGPGEYPYGEGQWWAEPDHDAAVEAMRFVGTAADSALAALGGQAATDTNRDFSLERVGAIARAAWAGQPDPTGARP